MYTPNFIDQFICFVQIIFLYTESQLYAMKFTSYCQYYHTDIILIMQFNFVYIMLHFYLY